MQTYTVICLCIWILTLSGVWETPARALRLSAFAIWFGGLLVLCLSSFTLYIDVGACNAAALFFPLYWTLYRPRAWALLCAVWAPAVCTALLALLCAFVENVFVLELGAHALCAELLLWATCMLLYGWQLPQREAAR